MSQFVQDPVGMYNTVAASATTQILSQTNGQATGKAGDYLSSITIVPGTATPGIVTVFDGVTAVLSIPAGTSIQAYTISVLAYSTTGSWNITTGAAVSVLAVGRFS